MLASSIRRSWLGLAVAALVLAPAAASFAYQYFDAHDLARQLEAKPGTKVKVIDEVTHIYPEESNSFADSVEPHLRFDTYHFRCAIPMSDTEGVALLRELEERRAKNDPTPVLVALYATVTNSELWGPVAGGKDDGVVAEPIVLHVEKVEKPRRRYYLEHPGDDRR